MDSEILKNLLKQASELYDEIYKNSNEISCLLDIDCIDFNKIYNDIDILKNIFFQNIDSFIMYLSEVLFNNIENETFDQLDDILKSDILTIINIKNLYSSEKRIKLDKIEKEIYLYCFNKFNETFTYNKLEFYNEFFDKSYNINNFIEKMKYYSENVNNNIDNGDNVDNNVDNVDNVDNDDNINNDNINLEDIKNIIKQYNSEHLLVTEIEDLKYTLWDKDVLLYKFTDIKTKDYKYIYFDLFKRKDKCQKDSIIKFNNNKIYVICLNSIDIFTSLKKCIDFII
jgi:hypothetical protein